MTEELIHTYTEDGLLLEGVRYPARADLTIVYTHGLTSTVFRQTHVRVARGLQNAGYAVVAGNNRGTALATPLLQRSGPRVLGGSWFERIEDAVTDIRAWMDVAAASGAKRIVLLGHSLGAIKAIRYAAETRDARLAGLVLASPPLRGFSRPPDPALVARASRAVDEGRAQELIDLDAAGVAFGRLSAATVLSWASIGDIAPRLRSTDHPVLAIFGTEEADIGGQAELDRIAELLPGRFTGTMIAGADHTYDGHEAEAAELIAGWIGSVVTGSLSAASVAATKNIGGDPVGRVRGILKLDRSTDRAVDDLRGKSDGN